ncbi:N-6 DNA methylase [Psychrobacillus vulpis]|uniref:site-specific DNA-methyltransferase (adenine-specific) n=1 Tax=Psychrobacillus vulpis TaxID=2325572 RepID=A0A544TR79_9BACI|nr:N-6 DNA methylase [Psychrobacillus vulpis]TQR19938.1 hypothetical protein FG384_09755 [Psychrobacillus vulpis]
MKDLYSFIDKTRGNLPLQETYEVAKAIVAIGDTSILRGIANSANVFEALEYQISQLGYSSMTKEQLNSVVIVLSSKLMSSFIIDLILEVAKALEVNKALEVFDWFVQQVEEKSGVLKADSTQTAIVKSYFDVQQNETVFSGRIGKGFEMTELLGEKENVSIYAQDFALNDLAIAEIRLHLAGYKNTDIKLGNILFKPAFENQKFDYVYDTPRFGYKPNSQEMEQLKFDSRFNYFGVPSKMNADLGYLVAGVQTLSERGKGAFYFTTGALSRGGADEKIRERLATKDVIEAVIEFPGGFYAPATGISSVLVLVNKAKSEQAKGTILFINAATLSESIRRKTSLTKDGLAEIISILSERKEVKSISKIVATQELIDYELLPSRYVFENEIVLDSYGLVEIDLPAFDKVKTLRLEDIATIYRGYNALPKDENVNGNVALLKISDIVDGEIQEAGLTRYELGGRVKLDNYTLQNGDIVLSIRGQLKLAMFESERKDVLLSQNFIGIRCKADFDPTFLKLYLESPLMQFIMQNNLTGSTILNLSTKDIEGFMIPQLLLEQQQEIVNEYKQQQLELKQKLDEILTQLQESKLHAYKQMGIGQTFTLK